MEQSPLTAFPSLQKRSFDPDRVQDRWLRCVSCQTSFMFRSGDMRFVWVGAVARCSLAGGQRGCELPHGLHGTVQPRAFHLQAPTGEERFATAGPSSGPERMDGYRAAVSFRSVWAPEGPCDAGCDDVYIKNMINKKNRGSSDLEGRKPTQILFQEFRTRLTGECARERGKEYDSTTLGNSTATERPVIMPSSTCLFT